MTKLSAGLLMCRIVGGIALEYFLIHPGGPYFRKKNAGFWSIPKGIPEPEEDLLQTAQREFLEETGIRSAPPYHALGSVKQKSGKVIHAWAFEGLWEPSTGIVCNTFSIEWPPHSGRKMVFPEVDDARWFKYSDAAEAMIPEQIPFLDRTLICFGFDVSGKRTGLT